MITIETINLVQRITTIIALVLLSLQIYTNNSKKILVYLTYTFIFVQPLLVILSRYIFNSHLDPFYMYTDLCVMCDGKTEYYINFLRIAFYSASLAIFAPLLKNESKWLKKNWKLLEYLYYAGFYSLSLYLYNTGPIVKEKWFVYVFWIAQIAVLVSIVKEIKKLIKI